MIDLLFPCKTCGHHFEDHLLGARCAYCWYEAGYDATGICYKFIGDNLKYMEDKNEEQS